MYGRTNNSQITRNGLNWNKGVPDNSQDEEEFLRDGIE